MRHDYGEQSGGDVVSMRVGDGDTIDIEGVTLICLYTPGHTDDYYCFLWGDKSVRRWHAVYFRHRSH